LACETATGWRPARRAVFATAALGALGAAGAGCHAFGPIDQDVLQEVLDLQDRRTGSADLRARLQHSTARVRAWAARALGAVGDHSARPLLARALEHDGDARVRAEAALALTALGGDDQSLAAALTDEAAPVRRLAALGLGLTAGEHRAPIRHALVRALDDPDPSARSGAAWALARLTPAGERPGLAAEIHGRLLADRDPAARLGLLTAMAEAGGASALLSDLAVSPPRAAPDRRLVQAAVEALEPAAPGMNPGLRAALRRMAAGADAGLAAAAAATLSRCAESGGDRERAQRALLDALAHGRADAAVPALAAALAASRPTGSLLAEAVAWLEVHTVGQPPWSTAACLEALAALQGEGAVAILKQALRSSDPAVRAAAARAATRLPRLPATEGVVVAGLLDRSPWVAGCTLLALAATGAEPVLGALATGEPELLRGLSQALQPPFDAGAGLRLLRRCLRPQTDPALRALAVRAAAVLADPEDEALRLALGTVPELGDDLSLHALPSGTVQLPWTVSMAPRVFAEFDWHWLQAPPLVDVRTAMGTFRIEFDAEAAPVHVHHVLRRLQDRSARPEAVLERTDGCLRLGRFDLARPSAGDLLRRQAVRHDPFARGVVGLVPSGLPDLDGCDLFITLTPQPQRLCQRTVVGRVVDGMEVVENLHAGVRLLDITAVAASK